MINIDPATVKKFYSKHKTKILIGALTVTTVGTYLMFRNQHEFNNFLREHDLFDAYYTPENSY